MDTRAPDGSASPKSPAGSLPRAQQGPPCGVTSASSPGRGSPGSPGSPGSRGELLAALHRRDDHGFSPSHPRSISLPQALHTLTLTGRQKRDHAQTTSSAAPTPSSSAVPYPPRTAGAGSSAAPSPKRTISEGNAPFVNLQRLGRSATAPKLSEIVYAADTDMLAIGRSEHDVVHDGVPPPLRAVEAAPPRFAGKATQRALSMPDILRPIFEALDSLTVIPHELVQRRRKPLSLRHAQLMFGNTQQAIEAWERAQPATTAEDTGAGLYSCLFVNSVWHDVASSVLDDKIHFRQNSRWTHFARTGGHSLQRAPRMLILHKLSEAMQIELEMLEPAALGARLEWLEFYTCPGLAPTPSLLSGGQLTRIVLPGCSRVSDSTMASIASHCPRLEYLDLRACELVTDRGIKVVAKYCPNLQLLNVGRTSGGDRITYKGIKHLARQTSITTLGLAGCCIDDRAIWELALNRGPHLQRLSLNNCVLLTDMSVPRVLGYMPYLTVLEIRGCVQITHTRPLALFRIYREKQGQPLLIEGCEVLERRMQASMLRVQREISHRIISDCTEWANTVDPLDDWNRAVAARS